MAEANKQKSMLEANGTAEGIMIKGDAEAFSVEAQAKANAEVMAVKADAWRDYQKAAKVSMWLEAMPKMAAEVAAPLSQVNRVTMVGHVDSAGPGESLGPAKLTGEVLDIMDRIPDAVTAFTGHRMAIS